MPIHQPPPRSVRSVVLAVLLLAAGLAGLAACATPASSSAPPAAATGETRPVTVASTRDRPPRDVPDPPRHEQVTGGAVGGADGKVPPGVTVFDDDYPAISRLDPALLAALRRASEEAREDGVELDVDSGWRSARYQQQLLDEAVRTHGSQAEAARWVAPPDRSQHVSGHAVDIGPSRAATWLSRNGPRYGLCQVYRNEPWHFELRPEAAADGCPAQYADPTQDPRLQP